MLDHISDRFSMAWKVGPSCKPCSTGVKFSSSPPCSLLALLMVGGGQLLKLFLTLREEVEEGENGDGKRMQNNIDC